MEGVKHQSRSVSFLRLFELEVNEWGDRVTCAIYDEESMKQLR